MAEAAVVSPASRFFCHKCTQEISPVLPEFICPRCQSGFIEEMAQASQEAVEESDEEIDPSIQFAELWSDLLQDIFRRVDPEHSGQQAPQHLYHPHGNESTENAESLQFSASLDGSPNPNENPAQPSIVRLLRRRRPRPRGRDNVQPRTSAAIPLGGGLPQLLASLAENRGLLTQSGGFPIFLNLHGNPGDYAWGRGGLDAVITQLLNQLDGTGPPPLPKDKIDEIPTVEITKEQVDKTLQCTVCMEDFKVSEPVKRLACQHHFHRDCIIPWLELHGTCPICRKLLDDVSLNSSPPPNNNIDAPGTSGNNRSSDSASSNSRSSNQFSSSSVLDFLDYN